MVILLTGSSGMVGRNILANPASKNFDFICPTRKELDLTNKNSVNKYFNKTSPDIIIHSAGVVGGIKANINDPVKFLVENTQIGINVIYSAFECGIGKLINLGSSCMYPKDAENPLSEISILSGKLEPTNEGYALAKIFGQRLCQYINRQYPINNYKTLIPCNLYGKYDDFNLYSSHLIPAIIRKIDNAIEKNTNVEIWGDGNVRREFMFVEDLVDIIYYTVDNYELIYETMNIGLGYDYSIYEYYKNVGQLMKFKGDFTFNLEMPMGMNQKLVSIEKQQSLGWKPKHSLIKGLQKTIDYYYKYIK